MSDGNGVTTRIALIVGALILAAVALRRPAPAPSLVSVSAASPVASRAGTPRRRGGNAGNPVAIVYVAGAVRRPGLYPIRSGERVADAIGRAGGLGAAADAGAVNLAAHAADGDEVYVPAVGEPAHGRAPATSAKRGSARSRRSRESAVAVDVDVNVAGESALAGIPGIGPAIASRIVEMRALDGRFTSLDELLDVAGMTQARLDRALPYLRSP